jgi:hypothetical protein
MLIFCTLGSGRGHKSHCLSKSVNVRTVRRLMFSQCVPLRGNVAPAHRWHYPLRRDGHTFTHVPSLAYVLALTLTRIHTRRMLTSAEHCMPRWCALILRMLCCPADLSCELDHTHSCSHRFTQHSNHLGQGLPRSGIHMIALAADRDGTLRYGSVSVISAHVDRSITRIASMPCDGSKRTPTHSSVFATMGNIKMCTLSHGCVP